MNTHVMQANKTIDENIVFVNTLLDMLSKRNEMDLHECYIIYLIHDVFMNVDKWGGYTDLKEKINVHILKDYYQECVELGVTDTRGLNIYSSRDKQRTIDQYLLNVKNIIDLL
jgi:hypothetical protein